MASLTITFTRADHLPEFDAIFLQVGQPEVEGVLQQGVGIAQGRSPVDQDVYRSSITSEIQSAPGLITGRVFSTDLPAKVQAIEEGRRPGKFPPPAVIEAWVGRKLAVDPRNRRSVGFLVARKIALEGIPGRFVFRNTFTDLQPRIEQARERIAAGIASRI